MNLYKTGQTAAPQRLPVHECDARKAASIYLAGTIKKAPANARAYNLKKLYL
jgi:hypothetical protein